MKRKVTQVITGRKIGVGILGCGRISATHINALKSFTKDAEIVALCDIVPEKAKEAAKTTGGKAYTSLNEMLKDPAIDLVSICTPSGLHPAHAIESARAGKHVISEKPMAVRWNEGVQMYEECKRHGVTLFIVKQNRLNTPVRYLKKLLDEKRLGRIHTVTSNVFWTRNQNYYDQAKWRGTWEFDGGAFMNQAAHFVDVMTYLGGEISEVFAMTETQKMKIEAEDSGVACFRYKSGALGSMTVTLLTYPKNMEGSVTVLGDYGTIRIGGIALNAITHLELKDFSPDEAGGVKIGMETESVYGDSHTAFYANAIASLQGKETPFTTGGDGLVSLQTLIAIYQSSREKRPIALPFPDFPNTKAKP